MADDLGKASKEWPKSHQGLEDDHAPEEADPDLSLGTVLAGTWVREDFSDLELPAWITEAIPPDPDGLYNLLCLQVTDKMIDQIALADYGQDVEKHRLGLEKIRSGVPRDHELEWVPNEVIQLHAWSEHAVTLDHHLSRAFCCAVLLRNEDEYGNRTTTDYKRLGPLIMSDGAIPPPYHEKLLGMIVDALSKMKPWDDDFLHFAWALAHLLIKDPSPLNKDQAKDAAAWYKRIHPEIVLWH